MATPKCVATPSLRNTAADHGYSPILPALLVSGTNEEILFQNTVEAAQCDHFGRERF